MRDTGRERRASWQDVVAKKRALRDSIVRRHQQTRIVEQTNVRRVTDIDNLETLVKAMQNREFTAVDVISAYIAKACEAQVKTNCLTEVLFDEALQRAQSLDRHFATTGELAGPLHGVPVSLKDQFDIKGFDTTLGYVGRAFRPATSNAHVVETLLRLGAIVIVKTNLPQSIMWCETENPLFGLTTNPLRPTFTPGGSSGGEAALLALHGSLIGWGTDIGGSIRIPAHMNGLWGLKPTSARMSYQGVPVSTEGQQHVASAIGPLARSLSSLTDVTKAVIESRPWETDPQCPPIPWNMTVFEESSSKPLTIGVVVDDGSVRVHPPIVRVLESLVSRLKEAGHDIVPWDASLHAECIAIMDEYYTADGGEDIRRAVEHGGEPFIPHVEALISRGPPISVYQYWQLNKRKLAAQKAYCDKWNSIKSPSGRNVDIILTPTMPHSALPHRGCRWVGYTKVWNLLDYTALSFPAGRVSRDLDKESDRDYVPRNANDEWNWQRYDLESMHGHPIGLQIVGPRFAEETVLGAAKAIEGLLEH